MLQNEIFLETRTTKFEIDVRKTEDLSKNLVATVQFVVGFWNTQGMFVVYRIKYKYYEATSHSIMISEVIRHWTRSVRMNPPKLSHNPLAIFLKKIFSRDALPT